MNRLRLDFSLETSAERKKFLDTYLAQDFFQKNPLTKNEIEICADYLLWGKDADGKNPVQKKEIQIDTKNKTWAAVQHEESLDALLETPTFNEGVIREKTEARPISRKEKFSRKKALQEAPEFLRQTFESLFAEIDRLDLVIGFYEWKEGRRKEQPRKVLMDRFSQEELDQALRKAKEISQFQYLKLRHQLVELRRQQYTLRDGFTTTLSREGLPVIQQPLGPIVFGEDIRVLPVGLFIGRDKSYSVFRNREDLHPGTFVAADLKIISKNLWRARNLDCKFTFDFRNLEHVYQLLLMLEELEDSKFLKEFESTTPQLLDTLEFYVGFAGLDLIQKEIFDLKLRRVKNQEIANKINSKYGKTYTANYISTIFKQKIIKKICEAATNHEKIVENLFFKENFKKCSSCGQWYLRDPQYFIRKAKAKDGLANRCKCCDKKARQKAKEG